MQVELTKFRIKQGKSELVDEWMEFLNDNMQDALLSLDGEKMFVETIMRDTVGDREYLYWYSICRRWRHELRSCRVHRPETPFLLEQMHR